MKRTVCAMLTAAAVAGCQSPSPSVNRVSYPATGVGQAKARPTSAPVGMPMQTASAAAPAQAGDVQQVGYNTGWGAMQNSQIRGQRVAAALPSHGGAPPGAYAGGMMGGMPPGVGGPGMMGGPPGLGMAMPGVPLGPRFTTGRSQIRFVGPVNMKIGWQTPDPTGTAVSFTGPQLTTPDRYNFAQGQIYRLKLSGIANREGVELYPTLEVYPGNAKVDAYLAHNAVPVEFTDEDFDQVAGGNYVTKVIYLPDAKYQELAIAGVETLVSTRLDPGVDPVAEAHRRGTILAVIRVGSVDLEMTHSPPLLPTGAPIPPGARMMGPAVPIGPMMGGMPGAPGAMMPPPALKGSAPAATPAPKTPVPAK